MTTISHPSIILPKFLASDRSVSHNAKLLLALLDDYTNRVTGQCNPRIERLARDLSLCRRTIERALQELRRCGLIVIKHTDRMSQYVVAARNLWMQLLAQARKLFAQRAPRPPVETVENVAVARPVSQGIKSEDPSIPDTTNCRNTMRQNVATDPPVSITDPTQGTSLQESDGLDAVRSVHQVEAAAAPPAPVDSSPVERQRPLRSALSLDLWRELVAVHPQPGKPLDALQAIDKLLDDNWQQATKLAATLRTRHAEWRTYWNGLEANGFIPQLWRWIKECEWMFAPVIRKPALRAFASKSERIERVASDNDGRAEEIDRARRAKGIFYAPEKPEHYGPDGRRLERA